MKKALKIVVLAKQVPDTRNVGKDAMTPEGTVNRAALPAIFNPEDLNALEMALALKDETEGSTVHILTMGPPRAADIIRDAMFRGADGGYLLTDRKFAGADTLATSYALSCALRKIRPDVIVAGRQAIDGDTAQVGPQVAEKLGWPQVTYAEEIVGVEGDELLILPGKTSRWNDKLLDTILEQFSNSEKKTCFLKTDGLVHYPSDNRAFTGGTVICACKKVKGFGRCILPRKATGIDEENLSLLCDGLCKLVMYYNPQNT